LALGVVLALLPGAAAADGIMLIQAGAFWMGGDSDDPNEAPLHRVYVRDFWIDRDDGREAAGRGASYDDPLETLRVTFRRHYEYRGVARGHHFIGFRCATSEDLGEMAK
jgi:formylglycine-generating enzyme required for sulfatase activity